MIVNCGQCVFYTETPRPEGAPLEAPGMGLCRRYPPQVVTEPQAAFFGPLKLGSSPLDIKAEAPGWKVLAVTYSTFPVVPPVWGCGEGKLRGTR